MSDRQRILKAAGLAYREGEKPRLTEEEQRESNENNHLYEAENPFYFPIYTWINKATFEMDFGRDKGFTTDQAVTKSGCRDRNQVKTLT
tara:strand:- start:254 stop:520 length:267 start_codon:yes stop_codon:yes gene_type:complete